MNYLINIVIMMSLFVILASSLNLLVGYTGLLSVTQAAFYGIGAYASTLLVMKAGLSFGVATLLAASLAALLSLVISLPSLRLKGDYFFLATLGFQIIVFAVLNNWDALTRGPYGISGIPFPNIAGVVVDTQKGYLALSVGCAALCVLVMFLLGNSPFGRVLKAIREDEIAVLSLGKNVAGFKVTAFAVSAFLAAIPGSLFAAYMRYIDPTSFTLMDSVFILLIIIIGGSGNTKGPVLGAIFMTLLPEALRFLHVPGNITPNMRQIIYGVLIILILRFRPKGLAGEYRYI